MEKRKEKDKLTILIDKEIKENYKKFCESRGLIIGKQIEIFMEEELRRVKNAKK